MPVPTDVTWTPRTWGRTPLRTHTDRYTPTICLAATYNSIAVRIRSRRCTWLTTQLSFACLQKKGKPSKASCCTKTRSSVSSLSKFVRRQDQPAATRPACQHQGRKFTWTKTLVASCPAGTVAGGALPATSAEAVVDFSCAALSSSSSSQSANAHSFISLILLTHPLNS